MVYELLLANCLNTPEEAGTPEEGEETGDQDTQLPDENTGSEEQEEPEDLMDLDEDQVPLGGYEEEGTETGREFGLPLWAGVCLIAAAVGILVLGICLMLGNRKRKGMVSDKQGK